MITTNTTFTPLTCTYNGGGVCTSIVLNPGTPTRKGAYTNGDVLFNVEFFYPNGAPSGSGSTDDPVLGDLSKLGVQVSKEIGGTTQTLTITRNVIAATPEPSSFVLLGTGLIGLTGALRKRFAGIRRESFQA